MEKKLRSRILAIVLILIIFIGMFLPIKVQATSTTNETQVNEISTDETSSSEIYYISNIMDLSQIGIYGTISGSYFVLTEDIEINGNWIHLTTLKEHWMEVVIL